MSQITVLNNSGGGWSTSSPTQSQQQQQPRQQQLHKQTPQQRRKSLVQMNQGDVSSLDADGIDLDDNRHSSSGAGASRKMSLQVTMQSGNGTGKNAMSGTTNVVRPIQAPPPAISVTPTRGGSDDQDEGLLPVAVCSMAVGTMRRPSSSASVKPTVETMNKYRYVEVRGRAGGLTGWTNLCSKMNSVLCYPQSLCTGPQQRQHWMTTR